MAALTLDFVQMALTDDKEGRTHNMPIFWQLLGKSVNKVFAFENHDNILLHFWYASKKLHKACSNLWCLPSLKISFMLEKSN